MNSLRALTQAARVSLDRSVTAPHSVVRDICLRKAARLIAEAELLMAINVEELPQVFVDAVLNQKPGDPPRVVAEFPEMTRQEFLAWKNGERND